jgi:hypothetical protein
LLGGGGARRCGDDWGAAAGARHGAGGDMPMVGRATATA